MVKPLPQSDFRAVRKVLEPKDFGLGPRVEPAPSDPIDRRLGTALFSCRMTLPCVAQATTDGC